MDILLTGGTGFIGSFVAMELFKNNHKITILARNPNKLPALLKIPQITIVPGDITDQKLIEKLVVGYDVCIHVALNYTRPMGWEVLIDDTLPTVYLSDMAARAHVKHFIYTSSTAVNDSLYSGGSDSSEEHIKIAKTNTKQRPATFYGATKAASENYLMAQSYISQMRVNIIRPGYTFGNPSIEGGSTQSDTRFRDIISKAVNNQPIVVTKNDGTQFIFAGDLARLYSSVLLSNFNRKTYYGMSKRFISWYEIALEAVKRSASSSDVILEDKGWTEDGLIWDVSDMKNDFGLEFDGWQKICDHLDYYIQLEQGCK
jgi:UDP-glucose 4-epimerase